MVKPAALEGVFQMYLIHWSFLPWRIFFGTRAVVRDDEIYSMTPIGSQPYLIYSPMAWD